MSEQKVSNITIQDAKLIFKNFQGKETQYNDKGNRNFGVLLDDQLAEQLERDGWKVRYLNPREDDPEQYQQPWLSVKVKFGLYPPVVVLITSKGKKRLDEETVDQLDWSIIKTCDLIIRPYNYPAVVGKNSDIIRPGGIAAYLKAIYVTIQEDELALKYGNIPDLDDEEDRPFE